MRNKELDLPPADIAIRLDPVRVQEYARSTGWKLEPRLGRGRTAVYERPESRLEQFAVPLGKDVADFAMAMALAVAVLARYENRPTLELVGELLLPPSDVLKYAESSPATLSGDVQFDHGVSMIAGARKTLLATACSVVRPVTFHRRMSLNVAEQFLQGCRLGQTERGSYVLTIACPLDAVPSEPSLFPDPFTRQVTNLLMRSLSRLAHHLERGDTESVLRQAEREPVLSANLCEGLLEMQPEGTDDAFLTIRAQFSRAVPSSADPGKEAPSSVRLGRKIFPLIERLTSQLRPLPQESQQFFVGFVETLNGRPNAQNLQEGQVVLRLITSEGENLRARAELDVATYKIALHAHEGNVPVFLEAVLKQAGRACRVEQVSHFRMLNPSGAG